mgnify:CR=1 FL=1
MCGSSGECFDSMVKCDFIDQCIDKTDESNCSGSPLLSYWFLLPAYIPPSCPLLMISYSVSHSVSSRQLPLR